MPRWVAIVANVSPNWTMTAASKAVSSVFKLAAIALATAVIDMVSWQGFIVFTPFSSFVNCFPYIICVIPNMGYLIRLH